MQHHPAKGEGPGLPAAEQGSLLLTCEARLTGGAAAPPALLCSCLCRRADSRGSSSPSSSSRSGAEVAKGGIRRRRRALPCLACSEHVQPAATRWGGFGPGAACLAHRGAGQRWATLGPGVPSLHREACMQAALRARKTRGALSSPGRG